ncbi:hypothetical protein Bhyg_04059 [Pseudolycoriella hygida]|uniref:Uncharacterized protein n=1 Tax=Pseudolycoriella hygida TaxID=35572 RepID=A0A9Q0NEH5_9DIPT|nr:hypothetical protein Bhyg_04059 [Pseudolycoriella hygida]
MSLVQNYGKKGSLLSVFRRERFSTVTVFIEELEELGAAGGSILANFSAVITSKEKEVGFDLEKPILIRPGMYYAICTNLI